MFAEKIRDYALTAPANLRRFVQTTPRGRREQNHGNVRPPVIVFGRVGAIALKTHGDSCATTSCSGSPSSRFGVSLYSASSSAPGRSKHVPGGQRPRQRLDVDLRDRRRGDPGGDVALAAISSRRPSSRSSRAIARGEDLVGKYLGALLTLAVFLMADGGLVPRGASGLGGRAPGKDRGRRRGFRPRPRARRLAVPVGADAPGRSTGRWRSSLREQCSPGSRRTSSVSSSAAQRSASPRCRSSPRSPMLYSSFSTPFISALLTLGVVEDVGPNADFSSLTCPRSTSAGPSVRWAPRSRASTGTPPDPRAPRAPCSQVKRPAWRPRALRRACLARRHVLGRAAPGGRRDDRAPPRFLRDRRSVAEAQARSNDDLRDRGRRRRHHRRGQRAGDGGRRARDHAIDRRAPRGPSRRAAQLARRAAGWYYMPGARTCGSPTARTDRARGRGREDRRPPGRLFAWRSVRTAALDSRWLVTPHEEDLGRRRRDRSVVGRSRPAGTPRDAAPPSHRAGRATTSLSRRLSMGRGPRADATASA